MHRLYLIVLFALVSRGAAAQLTPLQSPHDFRELEPGERYRWGGSTCVVESTPATLVCDGPAGVKTLALPSVTSLAGRVSMDTAGGESVFSPSAAQSGSDVLLQYAAYDDATTTGYTVLLRTSLPNLAVLWATALPGNSTGVLVEPRQAYVSTDIREGGQVVSDAIYAVSLADGTVTSSVRGAVGHLKRFAQQHRWAGEIIGVGGGHRVNDAITYNATVFGSWDAPRAAVQVFNPERYREGTFPSSPSVPFSPVTEPSGRLDLGTGGGSRSAQIGTATCAVRALLGTLSCSGGSDAWSLNLLSKVRLPGEIGYAGVGPTFSDYGFEDRSLTRSSGAIRYPAGPSASLPSRARLASLQWIASGPSALLVIRVIDPDTDAERTQLVRVSMQSGAVVWSVPALPGAARIATAGDAVAYATMEGLVVYGADNGAVRSLYRITGLPDGTPYPTVVPAGLSYDAGGWIVHFGQGVLVRVVGFAAGTTPSDRSYSAAGYRLLRSSGLVTGMPPSDGVGFIGTSRGSADDAVTYGDGVEDEPSASASESEAYAFAAHQPELIGGLAGLSRRIVYPLQARQEGIQGVVRVQFVVDEQGRPTGLRVARPVHPLLDAEAMRVVSESQFRPGRDGGGRAVRVQQMLPIQFQLQ